MKKILLTVSLLIMVIVSGTGAFGQETNALYMNDPIKPTIQVVDNNASDAPAILSILVYSDDYIYDPDHVVSALNNLGFSFTLVSGGGFSTFITSLNSQPWDLVIMNHQNSFYNSATLDALNNYLLNGDGCLIVADFECNSYSAHPLWANMGFSVVDAIYNAVPMYWWATGDVIFNNPNVVPQISVFNQNYTRDGTICNPTTGTALAGFTPNPAPNQAGIIRSADSKSIFVGYMDGNWGADLNANSKYDAVEFWENLIINRCVAGEPPVPVSNWALMLGFILIAVAVAFRYMKIIRA